nr:hypothetical protein [Paraflavitalea speifideiaquila]
MECIKRNTNGQHDLQHAHRGLKAEGMHHAYKAVNKEVEIFKEPQETKVHDHTQDEVNATFAFFFRGANELTKIVIHERGDHDQRKETPIPPAIKT